MSATNWELRRLCAELVVFGVALGRVVRDVTLVSKLAMMPRALRALKIELRRRRVIAKSHSFDF